MIFEGGVAVFRLDFLMIYKSYSIGRRHYVIFLFFVFVFLTCIEDHEKIIFQ